VLAFVGHALAGAAPTNRVTTSGISAGGFFAVQMEYAHSSVISGAAIFAGGPYFCAQDLVGLALTICMSTPAGIDLQIIDAAVRGFASIGSIDPLSNLANHKVYLYSGTQDTVVMPGVVQALESQYQAFGVTSKNLKTVFNLPAEHAMPTNGYGNACDYLGQPWINNCTYDGAGDALKWMLGKLKNKVKQISGNLVTIDQSKFTNGATPSTLSLAAQGYVYLPNGCKKSFKACRVHIVFHGCNQFAGNIGTDFVTNAGYNEWAESNNIIIIYPQTIASQFNPFNPQGCFDWWGYLDFGYAVQSGRQITTFMNMINFYSQ